MNGAHEIDMKHRIRVACYGLGFDLAGSHALAIFKMWEECATTWPPDSPPALGCLLALVREARGKPHAFVARMIIGAGTIESTAFPDGAERTSRGGWVKYGWTVEPGDGGDRLTTFSHAVDAAALVAALEAAPQVTT